jgi:hypothetical protein
VTRSPRLYALVAAVAALASVTSLRNGFVYDDVPAVAEDTRIRVLAPDLFTRSYWNDNVRDRIYRPLTTASFAVDWATGHGSPFPFHLTNLLLHAAACLLVFALARRILGPAPGALVAALWFAVHPVHVEAVANVVGRAELLAALGYLTAVLAYLAEGDETLRAPGGLRRAVLALTVLAGAMIGFGGKEHALTLPAALLLADGWSAQQRAERFVVAFRRHAIVWCGVVALAAGYLAARSAVVGTLLAGGNLAAGLDGLNAAGRAMVMAPGVLVWTRLLFWPVRLSADYGPDAFAARSSFTLAHAVAAATLVGTALFAWGLRRRAPGVLFGFVCFIITASVATNIVVPTGVMLAERVLYLPSVGVAIAVGALWPKLRGRAVWPLTVAAVALLAARTMTRNPVWQDGEHFYAALIHDAPDSYRSHWATGARAFEQHRPAEGERELLRAIQIYPADGTVSQELGEHYLSAGLWGPADRFLTISWRVDSLRADAAIQAVLARLRLGRPDSALALGQEALRHFPAAPTLLMATGDAWSALGQPVRALTLRRQMVFAFPRNWQYQHLVAEGAARAGRCDEARLRADRAVALAPDTAQAPRRLRALIAAGPTCGVTP